MSSVLVIQPPLVLSEHFIDYPQLNFLGACQAAAVLRQAGAEVALLDAFGRPQAGLRRNGKHLELGEPAEVFLQRLKSLAAEQRILIIAGGSFFAWEPARQWLGRILQAARQANPSAHLVYCDMWTGGTHYLSSVSDARAAKELGVDLVLRFQVERLLVRLATALGRGERLPRGVLCERQALSLADLPPPAFDLLDLEALFDFLEGVGRSPLHRQAFPPLPRRALPLVTARGCPFGCTFCTTNPGLRGRGKRSYRAVPWPRVESWIRDWKSHWGLERLIVLDDVANLDGRRFSRLLQLARKLGLRLDFPNGLRADRLSAASIKKLAQLTGGIKVSLESSSLKSQRTLLRKNLDPRAVEKVAGWCRRARLPLEVHGLIGIPGESRKDTMHTLATLAGWSEKYGIQPRLQFLTPLPGTQIYRLSRRRGWLIEEGQDPYAGFQVKSRVRTGRLDPEFLSHAAREFVNHLQGHRLRKVIVNFTYLCNNRCIFCAVGDRPRRHASLIKVLRALERHRHEGFELLDIDGGEPTLHPDLFKLIIAARNLGFSRITLITNGRRASYGPFARALYESGLDEVLVSLHAPEPGLQARLTSNPESFSQTMAGLHRLLDYFGLEKVAVNTTIIGENLGALPELGGLLDRTGVRRWNLQVVTPFGRAKESQVPRQGELAKVLSGILRRSPGDMRIQIINCPPCLLPGLEEFTLPDFEKGARNMVFVGEAGTNLQQFLARRRRRDSKCSGCPYSIRCAGRYSFVTH